MGGSVINVVVPREGENVGKVFVKFSAIEGAKQAQQALHGRKFDGQQVHNLRDMHILG